MLVVSLLYLFTAIADPLAGLQTHAWFNGIGDVPFSQENPPVTIKANMQQIKWGLKFPYRSIARKTPKSRKPNSNVQEIELCPYGCARLRMTEMPILK